MDGQRLKSIRETLRWTAERAQQETGKSRHQWYNYENNRSRIPDEVATVMEIAMQRHQYPHIPLLTAAHLKAFRTHFGLTQQEAAEIIGVTRVTWNRWEQLRAMVPPHMYYTLRGAVQALKEQRGQ